jgi:hypothetical protein
MQCYLGRCRYIQANSGARDGDFGVFEGSRIVNPYLTTNAATPYIFGMLNLERKPPLKGHNYENDTATRHRRKRNTIPSRVLGWLSGGRCHNPFI